MAFLFSWNHARAMTKIQNTINESVKIMLASTQECNQTNNSVLSLHQVCSECDVCINEIKGVSFNANSYMNQECMANFKVDANVTQNVKEQFEQAASAINSGLNIGYNSSDATTITELMVNLSTEVTSNMEQAINEVNNSVFDAEQYASKCKLAVNTMHDIDFTTYTHMAQAGTMTTNTKVKAYQDLDIVIKQVADAANKGLNLNFVAVLIAGVIAVIVVFVYGGEKTIRSLVTTPTGMVIILVVIYLVIAAATHRFPFHPAEKKKSKVIILSCVVDADCTTNNLPLCVKKVCKADTIGNQFQDL